MTSLKWYEDFMYCTLLMLIKHRLQYTLESVEHLIDIYYFIYAEQSYFSLQALNTGNAVVQCPPLKSRRKKHLVFNYSTV